MLLLEENLWPWRPVLHGPSTRQGLQGHIGMRWRGDTLQQAAHHSPGQDTVALMQFVEICYRNTKIYELNKDWNICVKVADETAE